MGQTIDTRCYAETCEHCGKHTPLYRIIHPDPVCQDWLVCFSCLAEAQDNLNLVWGA